MIKWGIVGTGRVANEMAGGIIRADGASLVGVVSRSSERGVAFAARHGQATVYASVDEMLDGEALDVVYVASPNSLHQEQVSLALSLGAHVLCEKPLANDVASCLGMVRLAHDCDRLLGVAFQYRQHPAHGAIRDALASGALGDVVLADAAVHVPNLPVPRWYDDRDTAGGGVLPMAGVHRIDLLRFVLHAEVAAVQAVVATRTRDQVYEDTVGALLEFDNGCLATLRFALNVVGPGDGVSVTGTRGWANALRTTSQWWCDDGGELEMRGTDLKVSVAYPKQDLYRLQAENFGAALSGGNQFAATGGDGWRAAQVTTAIFESARTKRRVSVESASVTGWSASTSEVVEG